MLPAVNTEQLFLSPAGACDLADALAVRELLTVKDSLLELPLTMRISSLCFQFSKPSWFFFLQFVDLYCSLFACVFLFSFFLLYFSLFSLFSILNKMPVPYVRINTYIYFNTLVVYCRLVRGSPRVNRNIMIEKAQGMRVECLGSWLAAQSRSESPDSRSPGSCLYVINFHGVHIRQWMFQEICLRVLHLADGGRSLLWSESGVCLCNGQLASISHNSEAVCYRFFRTRRDLMHAMYIGDAMLHAPSLSQAPHPQTGWLTTSVQPWTLSFFRKRKII